MTISHHLLRRTARWKKKRVEKLQHEARLHPAESEHYRLDAMGVATTDIIEVEPAKRGPYRYRVVTK